MNDTRLPVLLSISSALVFLITIMIAGELYPEYSHLGQYISELGAPNFAYAAWVSYLTFILAGSLLLSAIILAGTHISSKTNRVRLGKLGLGWYAGGLVFAGVFPCDANCSLDTPSLLQIIHSIVGWSSYLLGVIGIFMLVPVIHEQLPTGPLTKPVCKLLCYSAAFSFLLINLNTSIPGLWQRILEVSVFSWVILYTLNVRFSKKDLDLASQGTEHH